MVLRSVKLKSEWNICLSSNVLLPPKKAPSFDANGRPKIVCTRPEFKDTVDLPFTLIGKFSFDWPFMLALPRDF